jgi:SAM-dependent methyltransferase
MKKESYRPAGSIVYMQNRDSYRSSHAAPEAGRIYDRTHEVGYYAALWSKIEKPLLQAVLQELGGAQRKCLDFACGTGRITNVAADYFGEVVGVDVSAAMLARARGAHNVRLRQMDITRESLGETFDVITAFRFFLNAEQQLRKEALEAMREHLNPAGRLVCNIQMNATSPIGMASRLANRLPWSPVRNTMSADELSTLLKSAGLTVEHVTGYGYLPRPGNLLPRVCEAFIKPAERIASLLRTPARFAQQLLVVAKKE